MHEGLPRGRSGVVAQDRYPMRHSVSFACKPVRPAVALLSSSPRPRPRSDKISSAYIIHHISSDRPRSTFGARLPDGGHEGRP